MPEKGYLPAPVPVEERPYVTLVRDNPGKCSIWTVELPDQEEPNQK